MYTRIYYYDRCIIYLFCIYLMIDALYTHGCIYIFMSYALVRMVEKKQRVGERADDLAM